MNGTRLLHELVKKAIAQSPGLKIAADVKNLNEFPGAAQAVGANWICLLLPRGEQIPSCIEEFLSQKETLGLLVLSTDGSQVLLRSPGIPRHKLTPVEPHQIFEILRCTSADAISSIA